MVTSRIVIDSCSTSLQRERHHCIGRGKSSRREPQRNPSRVNKAVSLVPRAAAVIIRRFDPITSVFYCLPPYLKHSVTVLEKLLARNRHVISGRCFFNPSSVTNVLPRLTVLSLSQRDASVVLHVQFFFSAGLDWTPRLPYMCPTLLLFQTYISFLIFTSKRPAMGIDYRCRDGSFPVPGNFVTISNPYQR